MTTNRQFDSEAQDVGTALRRQFLLGAAAMLGAVPAVAAAQSAPPIMPSSPASFDVPGTPEWNEIVDLLKPIGDLLTHLEGEDGEQLKAELYQQIVMNISVGYFMYFGADPDYPDWMPYFNSVFTLQPNPDTAYWLARINGDGVYRITGNRGGARMVWLTVSSHMMGMQQQTGPTYHNYDFDEIPLAADGSFDLIISTKKPAGYAGTWLYLDPRADNLYMRSVSNDWEHERDPRFSIERVDNPLLRPRVPREKIIRDLKALMGAYALRASDVWIKYVQDLRHQREVNKFSFTKFEGFSVGEQWPQLYWQCVFDIAPDEALLLETDFPRKVKYWNVQVADTLFNQVDFINRQSSLNGNQAKLDSDGKFRAVLAVNDPGVPNWLDTAGHTSGMLIGRWFEADSYPTPSLTKIPLSEIRSHLPADTPMVSAAQRLQMIGDRRRGAQLRRRW